MTRIGLRLPVALATWGLVSVAGCRPAGPPSYRLSGAVTFAGKPVPMGKIYFDPVGQPGAASGYTDIVDGMYDTRNVGRGAPGGKTAVRIQGHSREGADKISGYGPPLFEEYSTEVDFPAEESVKDFDVPASAAKGLRKMVPLDPPEPQAPQRGGT